MKNIVLVGNPNCGKTSLFNKLTASKEYVGNWSGVTVSEKKKIFKIKDRDFNLVDLPGIYSLSGYSLHWAFYIGIFDALCILFRDLRCLVD